MSAIFGIIDFEGRPIDPAWIKSMQTDLAHRGPDGQGLYQEESMFLGHKLLQVTPESIYDKSPYEEDGFVITAYARLDEREAIMDRIGTPLEDRDKITDPLLLLRSFKKFGKDFVKEIYGDFAFAIWDKNKKELFCVRDQMGVKPFLYYFQDGRFVFSTELKAMVKLPFFKKQIDNNYLINKAIGVWDEPERTTWKGIVRLKAANTLCFRNSKIKISKYWKPKYKRNVQLKTESQSATGLRRILEKVISDHIRVSGDIGFSLSGGLDSSTLTCIAARKLIHSKKKIITVSSILDPENNKNNYKDEFEYIQSVLKNKENIDPLYVSNSKLKFQDGLNLIFEKQYAPINAFYYVDEALYSKFQYRSVRRVLSGHMGDLTISNRTINPLPYLLKTFRFITFLKLFFSLKKDLNYRFISIIKDILSIILPTFIYTCIYRIRRNRSIFEKNIIPFFLSANEKIKLKLRIIKHYNNNQFTSNGITNAIWSDKWDPFEEDEDCSSAHHQIEVTNPLIDRRVVEFLLQVPVEHFYAGGIQRGLIRESMKGILPEMVRTRKDKGDYSPGFYDIINQDIPKFKSLLSNISIKQYFDGVIDLKLIDLYYNELLNSKNNVTFMPNYWMYIYINIWISLIYYLLSIEKIKLQ